MPPTIILLRRKEVRKRTASTIKLMLAPSEAEMGQSGSNKGETLSPGQNSVVCHCKKVLISTTIRFEVYAPGWLDTSENCENREFCRILIGYQLVVV